MLKSLSVSQKAFGAFAILAVICALTGFATVFNTFAAQNDAAKREQIATLQDNLTEFQMEIVEHAFVGDTFLLSSDRAYADAFYDGVERLSSKFDTLTADIVSYAPELTDELQEARTAWNSYANDWMGEQIRLMERVDSLDFARTREGEGEGRRRFEAAGEAIAAATAILSEQANAASLREQSASQMILIIAIVGAVITLGASIGLGMLFNGIVSRPLKDIVGVTRELADGRVDVSIPPAKSKDEVGDLSIALGIFQGNLKRTRELEAEQAETKARAEEERRNMMSEVASSFEAEVMGSISAMARDIESLRTLSENVIAGAHTAGERMGEVATATSDSASNITSVAGAAEEMSATIAEISGRVNEVARIASDGDEAARVVDGQVEQLGGVVGEIESIVRLIADIAEQTNLLALNATIEAARAGAAGKGFAVVASEVKELASQTAKATEDVARQISEVRNSANGVATASTTVNGVIEKLNEISGAIAAAMEQQGASTREIATSVDRAAGAANSVNDSIGEVAELAKESVNASTQISQEASRLIEQAGQMQEKSRDFIRRLVAS